MKALVCTHIVFDKKIINLQNKCFYELHKDRTLHCFWISKQNMQEFISTYLLTPHTKTNNTQVVEHEHWACFLSDDVNVFSQTCRSRCHRDSRLVSPHALEPITDAIVRLDHTSKDFAEGVDTCLFASHFSISLVISKIFYPNKAMLVLVCYLMDWLV